MIGRPPKELNDDAVYAMAERGWSDVSIAAVFRVDPRTIRNRYGSDLDACRHTGKQKVLDLMYEMAFKDRDVGAAKYLCDRVLGPVAQKITITKEDAIRVLENELNREGISTLTAGEELLPETIDTKA